MTERTPQIDHPFPSRRESPDWYEVFRSMLLSIDEADFAERDQRNISVIPEGSITISDTGELEWQEPIVIHHGSTGRIGEIPSTGQSPPQLDSGQMGWVNVVRGPQAQYDMDVTVTSGDVPSTNRSIVMFYRHEDLVWIRQLGVFRLGQKASPGGAIASGDVVRDSRQLVNLVSRGVGSHLVGRISTRIDDRRLQNAQTFSVVFSVEGQVTDQGESGDVELFDAADQSVLHTLTISSTSPVRKSTAVSFVNPSDFRPYEVRAGMDSGSSGDLEILDAGFEFRNIF